jgi:hypothetical protein
VYDPGMLPYMVEDTSHGISHYAGLIPEDKQNALSQGISHTNILLFIFSHLHVYLFGILILYRIVSTHVQSNLPSASF